jgi:hypothetical protein
MQYQLVFQFSINEEFYFDSIIELETKLTFDLDGQYSFQKHVFATNEVNVYIATNHPDETMKKIIAILSVKTLDTLRVGCRKLSDEQFSCVYPPYDKDEFILG